jgi:hypothetical protein
VRLLRQTTSNQLKYGVCCRIHRYRECCIVLGLSTEPPIKNKNQRIRICKDLADNQFDKSFNTLIEQGFVQKVPIGRTFYAFYELTEKGGKLKKMD